MRKTFWWLCLGLLWATGAQAQSIHKCVGANGDITYSQAPCPTGGRAESSLQSMGIGPAPSARAPAVAAAAAPKGSRMLRTLVMCERTGGPRWCDEDKRMVRQCTPPPRTPKWVAPPDCGGYMAERKTAVAVMDACRQGGKADACARMTCAGGDEAACRLVR